MECIWEFSWIFGSKLFSKKDLPDVYTNVIPKFQIVGPPSKSSGMWGFIKTKGKKKIFAEKTIEKQKKASLRK